MTAPKVIEAIAGLKASVPTVKKIVEASLIQKICLVFQLRTAATASTFKLCCPADNKYKEKSVLNSGIPLPSPDQ